MYCKLSLRKKKNQDNVIGFTKVNTEETFKDVLDVAIQNKIIVIFPMLN